MRARLAALLAAAVTLLLMLGSAGPAVSAEDPREVRESVARTMPPMVFLIPVEDYAGYQPQTKCRRRAQPGVLLLADHLVQRGGAPGPITRSCAGSSISEHKEARAIDWMLDARQKADRQVARAFLDEILAADELGNPHALARRMGIMYVIWNDHIYRSYDGFQKRPYLSSGCKRKKRCSITLRHRDHVHVSLTRKAAKGKLSWYQAMAQLPPARAR